MMFFLNFFVSIIAKCYVNTCVVVYYFFFLIFIYPFYYTSVLLMSFVTCDSVDLTYVTMDTIMIGAVFFFSPAKNTHRKGL